MRGPILTCQELILHVRCYKADLSHLVDNLAPRCLGAERLVGQQLEQNKGLALQVETKIVLACLVKAQQNVATSDR